MDIETLRTKHKSRILEIAKDCHVENIRIFGSVARGDAGVESDVDFLVHPKPGAGFSIGGFYWQMEELLECPVDVVLDTSVHWALRERIFKEAVPL